MIERSRKEKSSRRESNLEGEFKPRTFKEAIEIEEERADKTGTAERGAKRLISEELLGEIEEKEEAGGSGREIDAKLLLCCTIIKNKIKIRKEERIIAICQ